MHRLSMDVSQAHILRFLSISRIESIEISLDATRCNDKTLHYESHVQAYEVQEAGAAAIRQVVSPQDLPGVLKAYQRGINDNFYLTVGASVATFFLAFAMGFNRIGKKYGDRMENESPTATRRCHLGRTSL